MGLLMQCPEVKVNTPPPPVPPVTPVSPAHQCLWWPRSKMLPALTSFTSKAQLTQRAWTCSNNSSKTDQQGYAPYIPVSKWDLKSALSQVTRPNSPAGRLHGAGLMPVSCLCNHSVWGRLTAALGSGSSQRNSLQGKRSLAFIPARESNRETSSG